MNIRTDVTVLLQVVALNGGEILEYGGGEILILSGDGARSWPLDDGDRADAMRDVLLGRPDMVSGYGVDWQFEVAE